jgi:alkylated DNA nucleotide flippase Atl1
MAEPLRSASPATAFAVHEGRTSMAPVDQTGLEEVDGRAGTVREPEESLRTHPTPSGTDPQAFTDAVLALTELIPAARVLTYGDVAELLGSGGPRQVGKVLSRSHGAVPWWRVLRSGGHPPRGLVARARPHYDDEGTALSVRAGTTDPSEYRVDILRARWVPSEAEHTRIEDLAAGL